MCKILADIWLSYKIWQKNDNNLTISCHHFALLSSKRATSKRRKRSKKTIKGGISKQTGCATMCLQTAECKSFNYCSRKLCQLNSNDFYSLGQDSSMVEDSRCVYVGMDVEERPHCEIDLDSVDIQEMSHLKNRNIFLTFN